MCSRNSDRHGFYPALQTWLQIPPKDVRTDRRVFVGKWNDSPPTPSELQVHKGSYVRLLDGNEWLIPVARAIIDRNGESEWINCLPGVLQIGSDGGWNYGTVETRYRRLWDIAVSWWQKANGEAAEITFDVQSAHDAVTTVLAANYRLGRGNCFM